MDKLIGCLFYSCAVAKLENQLVGVEALRDLKAELITRKEVWYNEHVNLYYMYIPVDKLCSVCIILVFYLSNFFIKLVKCLIL